MDRTAAATLQAIMLAIGAWMIGSAMGRLTADGPGDGYLVGLGFFVFGFAIWWSNRTHTSRQE